MPEEIELSPQQRRLWLAGDAAASLFHARCEILIEGALDPEKLCGVLEELIARHEVLRTTYQERPWLKVALQVVEDSASPAWRTLDPAESGDGSGRAWEEDRRPFDLERGPVLRATLVRLGGERHALLLSVPALSADAGSLTLLAAETAAAYAAATSGARGRGGLDAEPLQYGDYAEWQLEILNDGAGVEGGRAFWKAHDLSQPDPFLPFETPPSGTVPGPPASVAFDLTPAATGALEAAAGAWEASPPAVLLTAWQVLLQRLGDASEVVVGVVCDGRDHDDLAGGCGLYARCLPVRVRLDPRLAFRDAVARTSRAVKRAREWQSYCRWEEDLGLAGHAPVSAFGFEAGAGWQESAGGLRWTLRRREVWNERSRLKLLGLRHPSAWTLELEYDPSAFSRPRVQRLARQLELLLERGAGGGDVRLADLPVATRPERQVFLEFNDSSAELPVERPFHHLFEEQVARRPREPAVVCGARRLTYGELDALSNRLARHLRSSGVGPEVRVAISADRSLETVVALLAVLKAGGAYVPLDVAYPAGRLALMLEECSASRVLTRSELAAGLPDSVPRILLDAETNDGERIAARSSKPLPRVAEPGHLAYVIFTSGSTGRPKGVAVEHRQLTHYLQGVLQLLRPAAGEGFATVSTFAADLGHTAVFPALATGGCLHVIPAGKVTDPAALAEDFARERIDYLKIVPSHLAALAAAAGLEPLLPRRALILGGEAAGPGLLRALRDVPPEVRVFNHYGPTETTVGATVHRVAGSDPGGVLPLGRPLPDVRIEVLDRRGRAVPLEVPGEIYVSGGGVTRGYLGRPADTAVRFLPDPRAIEPGRRAYRTGDLGVLRTADRLDFLGRVDDQVKLRGYRIEPGEIEAALAAHPAVAECAVVVRRGSAGEDRLAGFLRLHVGAEVGDRELRQHLERHLPAHMVPASLGTLDALPRTAGGKVDRAALRRLEEAGAPLGAGAGRAGVPPRTPVEELLAGIWSRVLGLEEVGVTDNFFELGGDSIQVIEVVARAGKAGMRFQPQQLFRYQTIADLAPRASFAGEVSAEQGLVVGEVPLTPIQRWFFELDLAVPEHWNQAVLVRPRESLDGGALQAALGHLLRHHDALRARFERRGGGSAAWRQAFSAATETPGLRIDLASLPEESRSGALERSATLLQRSLDLARGPLVRSAFFDYGARRRGRLLVIVHHLAVDGVAWRILLQDLTAAYRALAAGRPPALAAKTTSFKTWAERLVAHVSSGALAGELERWSRPADPVPLPADAGDAAARNDVASLGSVVRELDEDTTTALLREAPKAYRTRVNDLLLTALLRTLTGWTGEREAWIELEGHGREALFPDVDLSRTVGWFTTHFPVSLRLPIEKGPAAALKAVKEQLRAVPSHGIGFGLLRYLGDVDTAGKLAALPAPEISFNYWGQLDPSLAESALFERAAEPVGATQAAENLRPYLLQVVSEVLDGRLRVEWLYSENRHRRKTVAGLAEAFAAALRELVEHCCSDEAGGLTPSDFPLAEIDQATLDALASTVPSREIEDLYPLSPLQEGLLFHTLYAPAGGFYVGQLDCVLEGEIDVGALIAAWRKVLERHPIFRTAFLWEGVRRPLQIVTARVELPLATEDWRSLPPAERRRRLARHLEKDRAEGYDLSRAPLMRMWLFRIAESAYHLVWSHHHLLLDGWSVALLTREVFRTYDDLRAGPGADGARPEPEPARPYRDYVEWLAGRDLAEARAFWTETLRGFRRPTSLAGLADGTVSTESSAESGLADRWLTVPEASTGKLVRWLRSRQLTVGTLVHGAWGILLSFLSGERDVVFGTTVAGRPTDLEGFESMIGLFINTLPVRVRVPPDARLASWLRALQDRHAEMRRYESTPLAELQQWCGVPSGVALFESVLVVENYPADEGAERAFSVRETRYFMQENFPLIFTVNPGPALEIKIKYERSRFSESAVDRLATLFETLFEDLAASPGGTLEELLSKLAEAGRDHRRRGLEELEEVRKRKLGTVRRKPIRAS